MEVCPQCGGTFSKSSNLKRHMKEIHGCELPKPITICNCECSVCGKKFARPYTLRRHMKQFHQHEDASDESSDDGIALENISSKIFYKQNVMSTFSRRTRKESGNFVSVSHNEVPTLVQENPRKHYVVPVATGCESAKMLLTSKIEGLNRSCKSKKIYVPVGHDHSYTRFNITSKGQNLLDNCEENTELIENRVDSPDILCELHEDADTPELECRLCGEVVHSELKLDSPCAPPYDGFTYRQLINKCFSLHVSNLVSFSSVCEECAGRLTEVWQFRSQIADTENKLLAKVTDVEIEGYTNVTAKDGVVLQRSRTVLITFTPEETAANVDDRATLTRNTAKKRKIDAVNPEEVSQDMEMAEDAYYMPDDEDGLQSSESVSSEHAIDDDRRRKLKIYAKFDPIEAEMKSTRLSVKQIQRRAERYDEYRAFMNASIMIRNSYVLPFRTKLKQFFCAFCPRRFDDHEQLREHTAEHDIATAEFVESLKTRLIHVDITEIDCRLCKKKITDLDTLMEHLKEKHDKEFHEDIGHGVMPFRLNSESMSCVICGEVFTQYSRINEHMNVHFPKYECQECGKPYATKINLYVHRAKHASNKASRHPCPTCGKIFKNRTSATIHYKAVHNSETSLRCGKCSETFLTLSERQSHLKRVHGIEPEKYVCSVCGDCFLHVNSFNRHVRLKHNENQTLFSCKFCGKIFLEKCSLKKHENYHTRAKEYPCALCDKKYLGRKALYWHKKCHEERPYSCSVCGQPFKTASTLKRHRKVRHPDQIVKSEF